jgi:hypothetical protein
MTQPENQAEALKAAIRAAKLALFVIRKQGVMPNSSWESGFNSDLATAEAALASLPEAPAVPVGERIQQRISVFREMRPEPDETWESWYLAAFDMLGAEVAALQSSPLVEAAAVDGEPVAKRLKRRIDYRLNDVLCEMKPEHDDSITGFNEAWDIVSRILNEELGLAALASQPAVEGAVDGPEEIEIDRLRLTAFKNGTNENKDAYYRAVSKWFQDRHFRRMESEPFTLSLAAKRGQDNG